MQFSGYYLTLLRKSEDSYANPYLSPANVCTIGYGTDLMAHRKHILYPEIAQNKMLKGSAFRDAPKKMALSGMVP